MPEILFRGKKTYGGGWIEGCLIQAENFCCILQEEEKANAWDYPYLDGKLGHIDGTVDPVDPETVGQFTGISDANDTKIFEGDIVEIAKEDEPFKVEWCEDSARFVLSASTFCCDFDNYWGWEIEVIGNIHDNPELLGGAEDD